MPDQTRVVLWQAVGTSELQHCQLRQIADGWRLAGTVVTVANEAPALIHYRVEVDRVWATRTVTVEAALGTRPPIEIWLEVNAAGQWQAERRPGPAAPWVTLSDLTGLRDIDLAFTPATNTLPVRRLTPEVGETIAVTAAWLRFPELDIELLPQTYHRLDQRRYHYESNGGAFTAEITFDDRDLVVDYAGLWTRIATSNSSTE